MRMGYPYITREISPKWYSDARLRNMRKVTTDTFPTFLDMGTLSWRF
jgi:hypothetical protein